MPLMTSATSPVDDDVVVSAATIAPASPAAYWTLTPEQALQQLRSRASGLSVDEAATRLQTYGPNRVHARRTLSRARVLGSQFKSPLLLLLLLAAAVSALTGAWFDAGIVLVIVAASTGIGFTREYASQRAAAALERGLSTHTSVIRQGQLLRLPLADVVPGDIVQLTAGSLVPGDGLLLHATDFFVSEAVLTGESFPVQKHVGTSAVDATLSHRANCVFLGTNVRSGTARCLVVQTGGETEFGAIAARLQPRRAPTEFDRGMQRFGYLLTTAMLMMVLLVFAVHMIRGRPAIETLLFAVALAVGLSPELLPAILTVNLARGAGVMAGAGVLVRRLNAIEDLGSMDVLCTDKTGTLTEGVVRLEGAYDPSGEASTAVLELAATNAALETGIDNPLDDAILAAHRPQLAGVDKVAEVPFDFVRKRVSVIVGDEHGRRLITKGAFLQVLEICTQSAACRVLGPSEKAALARRHDKWAAQGIRVLAIAVKPLDDATVGGRDIEIGMTFAGFLTFLDRPKEGASAAVGSLASLGVAVKLITGDARLVAAHVARLVGMRHDALLTGRELGHLNDHALVVAAERTDIFAEVDPIQKERIIRALRSGGHVVGFLGDGANDAPAMQAADTSLSVNEAVDVAREAADFVLLRRDLDVIRQGIVAGRKTFANTLKYILTTTSANVGNMASMAVMSVFLPFLPLTAGQILLNNFLSDIPAVGLADDNVDAELVATPQRWNMRFIGRFMIEFGLLSSAFDAVTFATLLLVFAAPLAVFRTGWFVESLLTELVIALVVRTRRPLLSSRPGKLLLASTAVLVLVALMVPYVPAAAVMGFTPLPPRMLAVLCVITTAYVLAAEALKRWFFRHARHA